MISDLVKEFLHEEVAAVGLTMAVVILLAGIVSLYISFILVGEFETTFTSVYTGSNQKIMDGMNQTTDIVITVLRLLSVGLMAWGGFLIISWIRG
ncbi:hypothetical protein [Geoglobus acetivorans]|uniref:Uncharacterized protein n=1 Tax=Geoglobus acetivorans TaxID=565033 RepID=A0A0A7GDV3_GEOAI|nr:hypothetical protein GACE_1157 [Geoglobus acetivorans]